MDIFKGINYKLELLQHNGNINALTEQIKKYNRNITETRKEYYSKYAMFKDAEDEMNMNKKYKTRGDTEHGILINAMINSLIERTCKLQAECDALYNHIKEIENKIIIAQREKLNIRKIPFRQKFCTLKKLRFDEVTPHPLDPTIPLTLQFYKNSTEYLEASQHEREIEMQLQTIYGDEQKYSVEFYE